MLSPPPPNILYPLHTNLCRSSLEDSDFLTESFHVGPSQTDPALDVTDVVVEVVQNAAVGGIRQAVEHLHHGIAHDIELLRS